MICQNHIIFLLGIKYKDPLNKIPGDSYHQETESIQVKNASECM